MVGDLDDRLFGHLAAVDGRPPRMLEKGQQKSETGQDDAIHGRH